MRVIACVLVILAATACGGGGGHADLQRTLEASVTGRSALAPGVTAYVSGPKGTWSGAAGTANRAAGTRMRADARLRLESVTKLWTATVVVQLAAEHRLALDDTLGRWLPAIFSGEKRSITIRELLNHTSGLVDNNDLAAEPEKWLGQVRDGSLRRQLLDLAANLRRDPAYRYPDAIEIRAAAGLPLLFAPGTSWHYSNIGYKIAGVIAERASGARLAALYERVIIGPLRLTRSSYEPSGEIRGAHPVGYLMPALGEPVPASAYGAGALGAEGGIVASAEDEGRFLVALVRGKLVPTADLFRPADVDGTYALGTGVGTACGTPVYTHGGAGSSWKSEVVVAADGSRVAVLLWNGRRDGADARYAAAVRKLFCAA